MHPQIKQIQRRILPLRKALIEHEIYRSIRDMATLHLFMQRHVFAVWDFMSLLKALQQRICCVNVPWLPPSDASGARLVNEIVLGEESDIGRLGQPASHFELYIQAMQNCGAHTEQIDAFLNYLRQNISVPLALQHAGVSPHVNQFVTHTFRVIEGGNLCELGAAFTFGREDLLPDVFHRVVDELNTTNHAELDDFVYYLRRHIELDGDEHGPLSNQLVINLCGDDEQNWQRAEESAYQSLSSRKILWDGILEEILSYNHETQTQKTISTR
jgi:hypothetical protein